MVKVVAVWSALVVCLAGYAYVQTINALRQL